MKNQKLPSLLTLGLALTVGLPNVCGGLNETLLAIQQSEFNFSRSSSEVPFFPIGWATYRNYSSTLYVDNLGQLPDGEVDTSSFDLGLVLPVAVGKRDMLAVGLNLATDDFTIKSGPYQDKRIAQVTPILAWLRQANEKNLVTTFAAPTYSKEMEGDESVGVSGYYGVVVSYRSSDKLQWVYGAIYNYSFGEHAFYPYAGALWLPTPKLSVNIVFPWPTVTYLARERWLVQVGIAPGGASWTREDNGVESTQSFSSWTLNAGVSYQLTPKGKFWLYGGLGVAGVNGLKIGGEEEPRFNSDSGTVFALSIQFRP